MASSWRSFFNTTFSTKKSTIVIVNFHAHARSREPVEEPHKRLVHSLEHGDSMAMEKDPF